jgi:hypothetical protein
MFLTHNLRPEKVLLRKEFLYDDKAHHGEYERAILVSAKAIPGRALEFEVMTDCGVLRDKLPLEAICSKASAPRVPTHQLQLWNCFSYNFAIIEKHFLKRCAVFCKDRKIRYGTYWWTFDFCSDDPNYDLSMSEMPDEHKCLNFIEMDDGNFMLQPNNRIRWFESSFITKEFPKDPDYKVTTQYIDVEESDKWTTSDDDKQYYTIVKKD